MKMYSEIELRLNTSLDYKIPVYRKFASLEEQNNWFAASDKQSLSNYLSTNIVKNNNESVNAPYGLGEVNDTGRVDVKTLISAYKSNLLDDGLFVESTFHYENLDALDQGFHYKGTTSKHIIFAEGYGITKNPFFNYLPLVPTKGELLTIYAPELNIDYVLKGPVFLIPLGKHHYLVGATYEWTDLTNRVTSKAKMELLTKLKTLINCSFEVVNQVAGVRPTVKDRRPLVGEHPDIKNMFVLNGLGTRGVMIGPYVSEQLYKYIEIQVPIEKEIDIARF
jgi:glycine/D-amino acid oxidase-like deaminating enzyme